MIFILIILAQLHKLRVLHLKFCRCLKFTVPRVDRRETSGKDCGFRGRRIRRSQSKTLQRGRGTYNNNCVKI